MASIPFKDIENSELVLLIAPSNMIQEIDIDILNHFVKDKKAFCIYVTVTKPYKTMINILEKEGIAQEKVLFIDCITALGTTEELQRAGNCIFCQPQSLTHISIALTSAIESLPHDSEKILILDTLSTLLLYNESKTVARFTHAIISKLRNWQVKSVIMTLDEETDKEVISQITQFCDKVIKIKD